MGTVADGSCIVSSSTIQTAAAAAVLSSLILGI